MSSARHARALLYAAFVAFATAGNARADDTPVAAQNEPSHHNKFENAVVRILDVEVPPGKATQFHTHSVDYPYLMIYDAALKNELPGKEPTDLPIKAGLIGYYKASQGAYTHRFVNAGTSPFRAIGIVAPRVRRSLRRGGAGRWTRSARSRCRRSPVWRSPAGHGRGSQGLQAPLYQCLRHQ